MARQEGGDGMSRQVTVVPYQSAWPHQFAEEAEALQRVLGSQAVFIHHIGSTAVPGLDAKPIIDMMPVIRDRETLDHLAQPLARLGYEALGEYGISGRRFFRKGGVQPTHHVHVYHYADLAVARHLALRDYLAAFPKEAEGYSALKRGLAAHFPRDIAGYVTGKQAFVRALEQRAWRGGRRYRSSL